MPVHMARKVDLERWWDSLPAHDQRALERVASHPLPHTLARRLLQNQDEFDVLQPSGQGLQGHYRLRAEAAQYVSDRAGRRAG